MTRHLTVEDVLAIAEEIGAGAELRDFGLLDSAVGRPRASLFGADAYPDFWSKAAALMHSIVANHPFVDGNKRTGLVSALAFLDLNGVPIAAFDESDAYDFTIAVASGALTEIDAIADQLRRVFG
ncbi:type II toxin-antitoxin system death-on-curing family toxin [Pilimelia columellifera]|uniref:Type II toxin-antitoxin system death-on-curing family toxin n=1 Tax=Pilimelia columellifera subsp. columellifera TaxID=706583 RepID=A0ABN3NFF3_9ACTN